MSHLNSQQTSSQYVRILEVTKALFSSADIMHQPLDWSSYWNWREQTWHAQHDVVAFLAKTVLLSLNLVIRLRQHLWAVAAVALTALAAVLCSWPLVLSNWSVYKQWRRQVLVLHYVCISVLVVRSLPHLAAAGSHITAGPAAVLLLLFKTGNLCMPLCAYMHRLPWQLMFVLSGGFMAAVIATRTGPVCQHFLLREPHSLRMINKLAAALDLLTGQGSMANSSSWAWDPLARQLEAACDTSSSAAWSSSGSSRTAFPASISSNCTHFVSAAIGGATSIHSGSNPSSLTRLIPGGAPSCLNSTGALLLQQQPQPATLLAAAAADPSTTCSRLLHGQCSAVVATLNVFAGIVVIIFAVVLSERISKWEYLHRINCSLLRSPQLPAAYREPSRWRFIRLQLLELHVLLDVPLMLLWVCFSSLFRALPQSFL